MEGFKEFQGKDLENAIAEACSYFDSPRERLEIEIVQDAKSGIFGIVGARKAKVRARRAQLREAVESVLGRRGKKRQPESATDQESLHATEAAPAGNDSQETPADAGQRPQNRKTRSEPRPTRGRTPEAPLQTSAREEAMASGADASQAAQPKAAKAARPAPHAREAAQAAASPESAAQVESASREEAQPRAATPPRRPREPRVAEPAAPAPERPRSPHAQTPLDLDDVPEGLPRTPLEELDAERLKGVAKEVVRELVRPITGGRVPVHVRVEDGRLLVNLEWCGETGLLIGREGQTLTALQYLASRMVSRAMNAAVRIQLDIGDYRLRQDEKLRAIALSLAEKARATGRPYSTRPLSSYHRRIIHLCLQDAEDLQTRSSGDGPLRRVVISRRKPEDA